MLWMWYTQHTKEDILVPTKNITYVMTLQEVDKLMIKAQS